MNFGKTARILRQPRHSAQRLLADGHSPCLSKALSPHVICFLQTKFAKVSGSQCLVAPNKIKPEEAARLDKLPKIGPSRHTLDTARAHGRREQRSGLRR